MNKSSGKRQLFPEIKTDSEVVAQRSQYSYSYCPEINKLEESIDNHEENSSEESASSNDTVIELETAGIETLPCENPILNSWGVAVYGRETDSVGKPRSASTSVNRIEFPDLSSTLKPIPSSTSVVSSEMVWDEGQWTGYKLNCHKKKKKVESLIELYDKDCVWRCWSGLLPVLERRNRWIHHSFQH